MESSFSARRFLLAGVAMCLYIAGVIVEVIARGIVTGVWAERRRQRVIEGLSGHDGTNDEDLAAAGLARARGLVASSDSDVDNLDKELRAPEKLFAPREDVAS